MNRSSPFSSSFIKAPYTYIFMLLHRYLSQDKTSGVAGYATEYSNDFTFITIRLAGHQVPKNNPEAALVMITKFLKDESF